MPRIQEIRKVLVIGSGPIIIGQAAEFDYAGTQACRALKAEGIEVVLVNSNPATIMTDREMADRVYLEPLQIDVVQRILLEERVDGLLATMGGQTGLNFAMELAESGFLDRHGIRLLGTPAKGIRMGEDREEFRAAMMRIGEPCIPSGTVMNIPDAIAKAEEIGYPVIVRPAFTLGGTGGGIADDEAELREYAATGLAASRVGQILVERCIAGWKEIEFEAVRDAKGNVITICSMENIDPVGVHTGDSIVIAPAQTLTDVEYQTLRTASLKIVTELGIVGGCNVQYAQHPTSREYAVIEVNPRLSRSSALASKATGYPIAKVAARIGIGYGLDEIRNEVTGSTYACFEPTIDYIVTKIPRWPFDKFVRARRTLGTQMKATGEVMSISNTLEGSFMKAIRSLETGFVGLELPALTALSDAELELRLPVVDDLRIFVVAEALRRGTPIATVQDVTKIDPFFLGKIRNIVRLEEELKAYRGRPAAAIPYAVLRQAKQWGFTDAWIAKMAQGSARDVAAVRKAAGLVATYKMVDTCAAEFAAATPYFYSTYDGENEAIPSDRKKVLVLGSGPIRIGQGIEFDYCSVHSVWALRELGYEAIIANSNPETVSTDFDTSDRLYFEPLTPEDVEAIIENEKPIGAICQFGGQTAIKLVKPIAATGLPILGTSPDMVDAAEDRERFDAIMEEAKIPRPEGRMVFRTDEALAAAEELGYPVLLRPSYVLGGQGMVITYSDQDVREYMEIINLTEQEHPILVDKYLMGVELEVDAVSDGKDILIPGIMEHLERAGIHSGDSISIFPAYISEKIRETIIDYTGRLARGLQIVGLLNIQFILFNDRVYVIEVNPRSSRTVPYISKVTGIPLVAMATRVMLGGKVADLGYGTGLYARYPAVYAIKAPVFSFEKLHDVDTSLGPEMKSTGEVLGLSTNYGEAMFKAILASNFRFPKRGDGILMTVRDSDKPDLLPLAFKLSAMGFELYATGGTALYLNQQGVPTNSVRKIDEPTPNMLDLVSSGKVRLLVNTPTRGRQPERDGFKLRRKCIEHGIPTITSLDTLFAVTECLVRDLQTADLKVYEIGEFAEIVRTTRTNILPLHEMPDQNQMLKK